MMQVKATDATSQIAYVELGVGLFYFFAAGLFLGTVISLSVDAAQMPRWVGFAAGFLLGFLIAFRFLKAWWDSVTGGLVKLRIPQDPLPHGLAHELKFQLFKDIPAQDWAVRIALIHRSGTSSFHDLWKEEFHATATGTREVTCTITLPADMPSTESSLSDGSDYYSINLTLVGGGHEWLFRLCTSPSA
jgi:hypothetical protein